MTNENTISVSAEIEAAHAASLTRLEELCVDPQFRPVFAALHRYVETWELRLLTSRIGTDIGPDTLAALNGALASLTDMKALMALLLEYRVPKQTPHPQTSKMCAETLLSQNVTPVR